MLRLAIIALCAMVALASIPKEVQRKIALMPFMTAGSQIVAIQEEGPFYYVLLEVPSSAETYEYRDVFITKDFTYYIVGKGRKLPSNAPVVAKIDMGEYENDAAFVLGKGKEKYYVFTAIDWEINKRFDALAKKIAKKGCSLYYYFLNVPYIPQNTLEKEAYLLSIPMQKRYKELLAIENGKRVRYKKPFPPLLEKYRKIAQRFHIDEKLTIINKNGRKIGCKELLRAFDIQRDIDPQTFAYIKSFAIKFGDKDKKADMALFVDLDNKRAIEAAKRLHLERFYVVAFGASKKVQNICALKKFDESILGSKITVGKQCKEYAQKAKLLAEKIPIAVPLAIFDKNGKFQENRVLQ